MPVLEDGSLEYRSEIITEVKVTNGRVGHPSSCCFSETRNYGKVSKGSVDGEPDVCQERDCDTQNTALLTDAVLKAEI